MMRLRREVLNNTPHEETASGAVATFKTDVPKLKECVVNIEPVQEGSGDPSPDNVRPISGWSEAKVYDDPKYGGTVWWNQQFLAASEWKAHSVQSSVSVSDGVITATLILGTPTVYSPAIDITGGTTVTTIAKHKYYMACKFNPAADGFPYLRNNTAFPVAAVFGSQTTRAGEWGSYENIISATATGGPAWYLGNGGNTSQIQIGDSFSIKDLMCIDLTAMFGEGNEPATVADFRAMFPNDYYAYNAGEETLVSAVNGDPYRAVTIDLDGTRYGGTLNVLTGVMRVDRAKTLYTSQLSIANWYSHDENYQTWGFYSNYDNIWRSVIGLQPTGELMADKMPTVSSSYVTDRLNCSLILHQSGANAGTMQYMAFRIPKTLLATPTDASNLTALIKAWLDENPIEISFKIAPFTVQLTPTQLRAIKGQNNIFSDCGDVAVKYWKHGG